MNNITTTTTIKDNILIVENCVLQKEFIKHTLCNFDLINEKEIIHFIAKNMGLIELIKNVTLMIKKNFPTNSFSLEFDKDPEIPSFNKLLIYVKGNKGSFEKDWEEIKKINKEIRALSLYDDSVKSLLSVDLW